LSHSIAVPLEFDACDLLSINVLSAFGACAHLFDSVTVAVAFARSSSASSFLSNDVLLACSPSSVNVRLAFSYNSSDAASWNIDDPFASAIRCTEYQWRRAWLIDGDTVNANDEVGRALRSNRNWISGAGRFAHAEVRITSTHLTRLGASSFLGVENMTIDLAMQLIPLSVLTDDVVPTASITGMSENAIRLRAHG